MVRRAGRPAFAGATRRSAAVAAVLAAVLARLSGSIPAEAADALATAPATVPATVPSASAPAKATPSPGPAAATTTAWPVGDELWDRPRSAEAIRGLPAIRAAVAALLGTPGTSLVIRHAAGQNDGLRAEELRHWLVALAVEPGRVVVAPASGSSLEGQPRGTLVLELAR
ncbi:MAG: hypothetical protein ACK515_05375 [bacterium]|jgi:hypothetical protein|nr:hypothetical protein [Betaproteobacteria bacterium]